MMSLYRNKKTNGLYELLSRNSTTVTLVEPGKTQEIYAGVHSFNENYELYVEIPKEEAPVDIINSPKHYTDGGIEAIDYIEAKGFGYNLGNVIKYIQPRQR